MMIAPSAVQSNRYTCLQSTHTHIYTQTHIYKRKKNKTSYTYTEFFLLRRLPSTYPKNSLEAHAIDNRVRKLCEHLTVAVSFPLFVAGIRYPWWENVYIKQFSSGFYLHRATFHRNCIELQSTKTKYRRFVSGTSKGMNNTNCWLLILRIFFFHIPMRNQKLSYPHFYCSVDVGFEHRML